MNARLLALVGGVVAIALVAAGCGGSDDSTTDSTASLTKAEFVKQGNEICTAGNEEIESGLESFAEDNGLSGNDQPTPEQIDELATDVLIPSLDKQVSELRDLGVPTGDGKRVEEFFDNAESTVEEVESDPSLLTDEQGGSPFTAVNREAIAIGLTVCGQEV